MILYIYTIIYIYIYIYPSIQLNLSIYIYRYLYIMYISIIHCYMIYVASRRFTTALYDVCRLVTRLPKWCQKWPGKHSAMAPRLLVDEANSAMFKEEYHTFLIYIYICIHINYCIFIYIYIYILDMYIYIYIYHTHVILYYTILFYISILD